MRPCDGPGRDAARLPRRRPTRSGRRSQPGRARGEPVRHRHEVRRRRVRRGRAGTTVRGGRVIVRDAGDSWQIVYQTDHADLSADFARAWANTGARHESLIVGTERHDDGWSVWEQAPTIDGAGRPVTFIDVPISVHVAFYRAAIAAVTEDDPYAGLMVSMHGVGIYRQRFGTDPMLKASHEPEVQAVVEAFVAEQQAAWPGRRAELGA